MLRTLFIMKKIILSTLLAFLLFPSFLFSQQKKFLENIYSYIEDPGMFALNQEPGHVPLVPYADLAEALENNREKSWGYQSLNGTWKFLWLENPDLVPSDFYLEKYWDQDWNSIKVPGNWEMQGFGDPMFRNVSQPFRSNPPKIPHDYNPTGCYRRVFTVPESWKDRQVFLRMEAVTSASFVWINGREVGFNEGANEPAEYNISKYLKKGTNTLAVCVTKYSAGTYLEDQDFWRLSGIFRDVSLLAVPKVHIRDYFVTTDLEQDYRDATLNIEAEIKNYTTVTANGYSIKARLFDAEKKQVGPALISGNLMVSGNGNDHVKLISKIENPGKWSAENPELYSLSLELIDPNGKTSEILSTKIGFRKVEVKHQVLMVNGVPVKLNGTNSHMQHPDLGHTMDIETMRKDLILMKQFNVNCVRTSHYPPNIEYLNLADELGMYIVDETGDESHATEFVSTLPEWKNAYIDRVRGMVLRDRNHPCIIFWSAGNESGFGNNICEVIKEGKSLDPTHLFMYGGNTDDVAWKNEVLCEDIIGPRYATPYELRTRIAEVPESQDPRPSFMDEYISVEGNGGGGFDEYWDVIYKYPRISGGAIWDWVSPGIREKIQLLTDESKNHISVAIKGRGKLTEGKFGKAVELSGHDQWIDVYRDPTLDITGHHLTLSLWIFPRKWNGNGQMITKGSYQFGLNQFHKDSLEFFVSDTKKRILKIHLPANWENNWHHVAGICDGSEMAVYIDGEKSESIPFSGFITNKPFPVNIGRFSDMDGQEYPDNLSNALFDRISVYNKDVPVGQLMNPSVQTKQDALLWLECDEVRENGEYYSLGIGGRSYGLIWPDRTPQPELYQVKKSAQPVHVELKDPVNGLVEITNRFAFTNLSNLKTTWELQADGNTIQKGDLNIAAAPSEKISIKIPWQKPVIVPGVIYRLIVSTQLKSNKSFAPEGFEVAWDQLELPWFEAVKTEENKSIPDLKVADSGEKLSILGKNFEYEFSKKTGQLTAMKYLGKNLIREGAKLNVWRAPIANDLDNWSNSTSSLPQKKPGMGNFPAGAWYSYGLDNLRFTLDGFSVISRMSNRIIIDILDHAEGADYRTAFDNHYLYTIDGNGEISISHTITPQGLMPAWLPKIGTQWIIDKQLNNITWYGRGPFENYPDRKTGARIGVYNKNVQDMKEPYLVSQDYGCRTDNRWVRLESEDGTGIQFSGNELFNFSAQVYSTDNLSRARYPYQLTQMDGYAFNFDYATSGLGCTSISVLNKYRVMPQEYHFTMNLKPFKEAKK